MVSTVKEDKIVFFPQVPLSEKAPLSFISSQVSTYVENVETFLGFVSLGDTYLPCTVNEKEFDSSYVVSNFYVIHHVRSLLKERKRRFVYNPFLSFGGHFLKLIGINQYVNVNNWLMTNSVYPIETQSNWNHLIQSLITKFPKHYLMFRNLNEKTGKETLVCLKNLGCSVVFSRNVYLFDPNEKMPSKARYHYRRDQRLLDSGCYSIKGELELSQEDFSCVLQLYLELYVKKFTSYSPIYTLEFLKGAVKTGMLKLRVLLFKNEVVGVIGYHHNHREMVLPFFGYALHHEHNRDIYRLLIHLAIVEAQKLGVVLNDGTGGDQAKKNRGMQIYKEYAALYTSHLSFFRRFFWRLATFFS
jgi:hypothetical protein